MKLKTKLLVGFLVVTLVTLGMGLYAVYGIRTLDGHVRQLYDRVLMVGTYAEAARSAFVRADRAAREAAAAATLVDLDRYTADVAAAEKLFLEDLDVVRERALDPDSVELIREIRALYDRWQPVTSAALDAARRQIEGRAAGRPPAPAADASDRVLAGRIEEHLATLSESAAEAGFAFREASARLGRQTLYIAYGAIALAILTSVVVSLVLARAVTTPLRLLGRQIEDLGSGEGDLSRRLEIRRHDEIGDLARRFNAFVEKLQGLIGQVGMVAGGVATASRQLAAASGQLSRGAQEQASALEETAASLEQITGTIKQNADNARQANQLAVGSRDTAEQGGEVVSAAVSAMAEINRASTRIADIITTIDEIAFQTNLLALNAAVEAARAGEQGRGFAVVAAEVRNLAQRSAGAAKEIKGLIQDSVQKVEGGSELVNRSGQTLTEIVGSVKRVTDIIAEIAAASEEQAQGIDQVNRAVSQMDQVVQGNATQTEQLTSTAAALAAQAGELQGLVGRFRLGAGKASRPWALIQEPSDLGAATPRDVGARVERGAPPAREMDREARPVSGLLGRAT